VVVTLVHSGLSPRKCPKMGLSFRKMSTKAMMSLMGMKVYLRRGEVAIGREEENIHGVLLVRFGV
jgi:hypothetical protein